MERADANRLWLAFCRRHRGLWRFAATVDPGTWRDLEDTAEEIRQRRTGGQLEVQECVPTCDAATQTEPAAAGGGEEFRVDPGPQPLMRIPVERPAEFAARTVPPRMRAGCWNCGGCHRYSNCTGTRRLFCYGCGAEGTTLADCRRCGSRYHLVGPYTRIRGPRDRSRPPPSGAGPSRKRRADEPPEGSDE